MNKNKELRTKIFFKFIKYNMSTLKIAFKFKDSISKIKHILHDKKIIGKQTR